MFSDKGLGLGTFPFENVFTPVSDIEVERIIFTYLKQGGKYIVTAPYYRGVAERLKPVLAKIPREEYVLFGSCVKNKDGVVQWDRNSIFSQCEDSLCELGVDYLDVLLTSDANSSQKNSIGISFEETMDAMRELKRQGKVKALGVANVNLDDLQKYNWDGAVEYVSNRFSFLNRSFSNMFNEYCSIHGIQYVCYEVLERGLLTDKILGEFILPERDFRSSKPEFSVEVRQVLSSWARLHLAALSENLRIPIEGLALWWALGQPNMSVCIFGATSSEQVLRNFSAVRNSLPIESTMQSLEIAYNALEEIIDMQHPTSIQKFMRVKYRP